MNIKKLLIGLIISLFFFIFTTDAVLAHPGRTDANGGHTCRTNCEQWGLSYGEYHYHNGGSAPAPDPVPAPPALQPSVAPVPTIKPSPKIVATPKPKPSVTPKPSIAPTPTPTATPTPTPTPIPSAKPKVGQIVSKLISDNAANPNATIVELILTQLKAKPGVVLGESVQPQGFVQVKEVIDGDTIRVMLNGKSEKVRLLGIDTPETVDPRKEVQCFGLEASKKLKELITGKNVRLENDTTQPDKDKYNRLLRWVYLEDGTDINLLMVQEGYAFSYKKYPTQKLDQLNQFEKEARENNLGLWNSCNEYE